MKKMYQKVALLFVAWFWVTFCFAAVDYSSLSNNLAEMPGIQSTTKGYDLLSGKVTQSVPLVKGSIPFTMKYQASLRLSSDGGVDYYQNLDEGGIADWSNEYSGYIMTNSALPAGMRLFIIQLPGSSEKHIIAFMDGKWKRIYFSGSGQSPAQTFTSENLKDIAIIESGNTVSIIKDGVTYTAATSKTFTSFGKSDTLLKFTQIKFQDGRQLDLTYDNGINLVQVKDNRNNILNILREYKKPGADGQSYLERKLITGVELISGSDIQRSTITYQENQVNSIIDPNQIETRYTITDIDSIVVGKLSYQYENQSRGYWLQYVRNNISRNITNAAEGNLPILKRVLDQESNVLREYEYGNVWEFFEKSNLFLIHSTQITSYSPINGVQTNKSISYYDDMRGIFTNRFVVNGQQQTVDITVDPSNLGNYVNEANLGLMSTATATVTVSGDYPSLISGSTPIRTITFNPFTHRIVSMKDFNGNLSNFSYDNLNRLTQQNVAVDTADLQTTSYNYTTLSDGSINKYPTPNEIITDSQTVTNTIDLNGWITQQSISYPKGGDNKTINYSYYTDPNISNYGLISSVDGPRADINDITSISYDNFGNKSTITQDVNNRSISTQYLNYNSFSQPERVIHPSGVVDKFIYNADGTLQAMTTGSGGDSGDVSGATTTYSYDYLKRKKTETNADNETTLYDYDGLGRLIRTTLPDGSVTTQSFYDNGEVQSIDGASITYNEINVNGRISKTRSGNVGDYYWKTFTYDGNGNITQTQTALGITETWTFDALNRNISYTDGSGNTSFKSYDKSNNLVSSKDSMNSGSSPFNYVNSNLVKDEINNDYATKSYTYNQADQVVNKIHGSRNCSYSNIDSLGRMGGLNCASENDADSAYGYNYQYTYDNSRFGRLDSVSSNAVHGVSTQYSYDALDRITGKTQSNKAITAWGANSVLSVSYAYTLGGKNTSITMPSGRSINYHYDGNKGRLASVEIAGNPFISNISYTGLGQLSSWNIENTGAHYAIGYDASQSGSIKSIAFNNKDNVGLYREEYGFDQDGRVVTLNKLNGVSQTYAYDNSNRLIKENDQSYTYDKNGNRTSSSTNSYSYDVNSNRLSSINELNNNILKSSNYASTGELRFDPFISGYDGNGQMRYSGGADGTYYMAYNHKNERTIRSSNLSGDWYANAIQFIYDESSNLLGEYAPDGTPIVEYVWIGSRPVAAIYGTGDSTKIYAIVTDHNNTPRMLVNNATNEIVWNWESTAFGVGQPTGNITFNLRFPGQYYDQYTGLHYNLNRYYNPELGRYMEPDPIGLEGGSNPYAYAGSNPISNVDPSGLDYSSGYSWGWLAPERTFSQNQTFSGVQNQFQYGSGAFYADPMQFDFQKVVDIPQQIQSSALGNGYFNQMLNNMEVGATSNFQFLNKSIGGSYFESIQTYQWPFGRVSTNTYGSITKNADYTYSAIGVISFSPDFYSWKSDGNFIQNVAIRIGGMAFGSKPSASYLNKTQNSGQMPVFYPRKMWFSSTGNWK